MKNARPKSLTNWFNSFDKMTKIENLNYLDTRNVTKMNSMFHYCKSLTSLDLSNFDTGNVEDMEDMFGYCNALTTLDLSSFDTGKVNT